MNSIHCWLPKTEFELYQPQHVYKLDSPQILFEFNKCQFKIFVVLKVIKECDHSSLLHFTWIINCNYLLDILDFKAAETLKLKWDTFSCNDPLCCSLLSGVSGFLLAWIPLLPGKCSLAGGIFGKWDRKEWTSTIGLEMSFDLTL